MKNKPERWRRLGLAIVAAGVLGLAAPAAAQLGGLGRALPGVLQPLTSTTGQITGRVSTALDPRTLVDVRLDRLDALVRAHPRELERDDHGAPVVRGEVLAIAPTREALAAARNAGFDILRAADPDDAVALVVLRSPPGMKARDAVRSLRKLDPAGVYDFNHVYEPSGEAEVRSKPVAASHSASTSSNLRIGLIDTAVDTSGAAFSRAHVEQRAFADANVKPASHGTAVASLIVGDAPPFRGSAPGAALYAADVYGAAPTGGSAEAIVRAFGWLTAQKVTVINVSLVGPPNLALAASVKAVQAKTIAVVAAVGNDGPAAPPAYPASYPGVVAVTGVDARGRVLIEAGRAQHLDFAAPGADMAAAAMGGGYVVVRGTSFAAPLVTGRLAELMRDKPFTAATDLLENGATHKSSYGRGLVAMDLRTPPGAVHAKSADPKLK